MSASHIELCDGCGATIVIQLPKRQALPTKVYCPGCTKLNAAKQQAFVPFICIRCGKLFKIYRTSPQRWCPACQSTQTPKAQAQAKAQQKARYQAVAGYRRSYQPGATAPGSGQSQKMQQCSFTWDVLRQAYSIEASFQPNFIEFIKAKVPVSDRVPEYDSVTRKFKCWYIKEAWFDILYELASQLWPGGVYVLSKQQAQDAWSAQEKARADALAAQRAAVLGPFEAALLDFCSLCDVDALRAARNKMAIALHPDKGGDPEKMSKLNASWFIVETELKKRSEVK